MKKYNFNTINNLTTPEGWIEKALEIPQLEEKRRSEVRRRSVRYASLAASIVLVGALAVILFMNKGNQPPVVTAPMTSETVSYDFERSTQAPTHPATVAATAAPTVAAATAAQPTVAAARATAPTQPGTQNAVFSPEPSDIYDEPTQPVIVPEISTQAPTQPPAPTQAPTQPTKVAPTEELEKKSPDLAPVGYDGIIIEKVPKDDIPDDSLICCRIYSEDGEILGDGDPYSEQHHARWYDVDGIVTMYYVPDGIDLPNTGVYRYEFYDAAGNTLSAGDELLMHQV